MPLKAYIKRRKPQKDLLFADIRKKLGITQWQLAGMFGHSRNYITMVEAGKRQLHATHSTLLYHAYLQMRDLESGKQPARRSEATKSFIQAACKKAVPGIKAREEACLQQLKIAEEELAAMQQRARDAEHAIIVYTTLINNIKTQTNAGKNADLQLKTFSYLHDLAHKNLLRNCEAEQLELEVRIEMLKAEGKALRRWRKV